MRNKSLSCYLIKRRWPSLFLGISLVFSGACHAFNWDECDSFFTRQGNKIVGLTELASSSSQFISSTGACSMIGEIVHDRRVFVTQSIDKLQDDIARGDGEYLQALAELYECPAKKYSDFARTLKENYLNIFDLSQRDISKLDGFILNSFEIKNACSDLKKT